MSLLIGALLGGLMLMPAGDGLQSDQLKSEVIMNDLTNQSIDFLKYAQGLGPLAQSYVESAASSAPDVEQKKTAYKTAVVRFGSSLKSFNKQQKSISMDNMSNRDRVAYKQMIKNMLDAATLYRSSMQTYNSAASPPSTFHDLTAVDRAIVAPTLIIPQQSADSTSVIPAAEVATQPLDYSSTSWRCKYFKSNTACADDLTEALETLGDSTRTVSGSHTSNNPLSGSDIALMRSQQAEVQKKIDILNAEMQKEDECDADCTQHKNLILSAESTIRDNQAAIDRFNPTAKTASLASSPPAPVSQTTQTESEIANSPADGAEKKEPQEFKPKEKTSVAAPVMTVTQEALPPIQEATNKYETSVRELKKLADTYYALDSVTQTSTNEFDKELKNAATYRIEAIKELAAANKDGQKIIDSKIRAADKLRQAAFDKVQLADKYRAERKIEDVLGRGFGDKAGGITRYSETTNNALVNERGGAFAEAGVGEINSIFYNIKDYLKYFAAALAILWLTVSAFRLVTSQDDERIQGAKKGIKWALIGLILIFVVDLAIVAFFEGGQLGTPGQSLVGIDQTINADGTTTITYDLTDKNQTTKNLMASIADYFTKDVRVFFEFLKVLGSAMSILMIFVIGFWLVNAAGNEEAIEAGKKYLMHVLTAFVVLLMLDAVIFKGIYPENTINIVVTNEYGEVGYVSATVTQPACLEYLRTATKDDLMLAPTYSYLDADGNQQTGQCTSAAEIGKVASEDYILGIVRFFQTLIGAIAVLFLVYSAIQIIGSFGNEETIEQHKKQALWSLAGLGVIVLSESVIRKFFFITDYSTGGISVNTSQGIADIAGVTNFVATFVGVFSFIGMLIAGIMWVANFGNQEIGDKAKKIIIYSIIGIIISISAFAVVNSITSGRSNPKDGIQFDATLQTK